MSALSMSASAAQSGLTREHAQWLTEETAWIITDTERDLFLSLQEFEQRERFIEAFWDQRDPDRLTPDNEFRREHEARLQYARTRFREESKSGPLTERGRFYILLGAPQRLDPFVGDNELTSCELWTYAANADQRQAGLPNQFNLLFFKENDIGDYQLYQPLEDGPEALLRSASLTMGEPDQALEIILRRSVQLARASMGVDLTDPVTIGLGAPSPLAEGNRNIDPVTELRIRPSAGSSRAMAAIMDYSLQNVDTSYIDGYLNYGERVSSEYSFKYIANEHVIAILHDESGNPFVHYSVELSPQDITFLTSDDGESYYTTLDVKVELRSENEAPLLVQENAALLELDAKQMEAARNYPVAIQDSFPVVDGDYAFALYLSNRTTGHFTIVDEPLSIPFVEPYDTEASQIVLGYRSEQAGRAAAHRTFEIENTRIFPSPPHFSADEDMELLFQLLNPREGQYARLEIVKAQGNSGTEVRPVLEMSGSIELEERSEDAPVQTIVHRLPLDALRAGDYLARLVVEEGLETLLTRERTFSVIESPIARPALDYRRHFATEKPGLVEATRGQQFFNQGRLVEAEIHFREAVAFQNPELAMARWQLASLVLFKRDADQALALLEPLAADHPNQIEVIEGLGFSYYLKQNCEQAVPHFEHALGLRPPDNSVLNAAADCFQILGRTEKAIELFRLSLEIQPGQGGVSRRLQELTEKR